MEGLAHVRRRVLAPLWARNVTLAAGIAALTTAAPCAPAGEKSNRWKPRIRAFEAQDRQDFPPKRGILFIGSSSIVGWDLSRHFPHLPVINRGFGGSHLSDAVHYADRIVLPYEPRIILLYAGDNDIAAGKSPQRVLADYRKFVAKVHRALPETRILYIAIKPSIRRWKLVDRMREANASIRAVAAKDERLVFVDVEKPMIGEDGRPREELFRADGLHLNPEGYRLWSDLVRPHLHVPQGPTIRKGS